MKDNSSFKKALRENLYDNYTYPFWNYKNGLKKLINSIASILHNTDYYECINFYLDSKTLDDVIEKAITEGEASEKTYSARILNNEKLEIKIYREGNYTERGLEFLFIIDFKSIKFAFHIYDFERDSVDFHSKYYEIPPNSHWTVNNKDCKYTENLTYYIDSKYPQKPQAENILEIDDNILFREYFLSEKLNEKNPNRLIYIPTDYERNEGNIKKKARFVHRMYQGDKYRYIFTIEDEKYTIQFRINIDKTSKILILDRSSSVDNKLIINLLKQSGYDFIDPDDENKICTEYCKNEKIAKELDINEITDKNLDLNWIIKIIEHAIENGISVDESQYEGLKKYRDSRNQGR